jgi:hypothetical protein
MQRQRSRRRQALQTPPAYAQNGIYTDYTYNTHGHLGYCPGHTRTTGCVCARAPLPVRGHRIPAQAGLQFVDAEYAVASFSIRSKHVESCLAAGHHGWHPYTPTWRTDILLRCLCLVGSVVAPALLHVHFYMHCTVCQLASSYQCHARALHIALDKMQGTIRT